MNPFLYYGLIDDKQKQLLFTHHEARGDKIDEDHLNDFAKYNPMIKRLKEEFNLEL